MSAAGTMASMIGRLHHLILDCSDPLALATFYSDVMVEDVAEAPTVNQCPVSDVLGGMTGVGHGRARIIRAGL